MTLALSSAAAPFWSVLWPRLMALHWADPRHPASAGCEKTGNAQARPVVMRGGRPAASGAHRKTHSLAPFDE